MLENPPTAAQPQPAITDSATVTKRYAPPNQRNRPNRRKSADKSQVSASKNVPVVDHGDAGGSSLLNDNSRPGLIALDGCSNSEASQLLNDRWAAAIQGANDTSIDPSERPIMHTDKAPAWGGQFRLPHQFMSPTGGVTSPGSQMDFLSELRRAKSNASASFDS